MTSGVFAQRGDQLTVRESEVLIAYAQLGSIQATADLLGMASRTTKGHLTSVHKKLGTKSSIEAWHRFRIG
jgi:DNA-binding CsgD family transcriptional regulator